MLTKTFFAAGALLSVAAAVPMQQNKRDVVWTTDYEMKYVTVDVTTTMWLQPGETPPAAAAAAGNGPAPDANAPGHYGHKNHGRPKQSPAESPVDSPAAPSPPTETPEASYAAPTTPAAPQTPSTPYVAPTPTTTEAAAPTAPAYTAPAAPSPSTPSSGSSSGGSGAKYHGDMTYYTPGMGSCGVTNNEGEAIVALAQGMMTAAQVGGNPNENPLCGKSITISWEGKTATAKIMDTCPGCANGGLDLTPTLFQEFAPLGEGRLTGMTWWYN